MQITFLPGYCAFSLVPEHLSVREKSTSFTTSELGGRQCPVSERKDPQSPLEYRIDLLNRR